MNHPITPYLFFNGNCREAMQFYKTVFGGELQIMSFDDVPPGTPIPPGAEGKVMHSMLKSAQLTIMGSDSCMGPAAPGERVQLMLSCTSVEQIESLFQRLLAGGTTDQPLSDTFWGARFGAATDQFGICWLFNYEYPKK